jgi:DNA-binding beta-propeller fold protein YncE/cytochrome c peroxidase
MRARRAAPIILAALAWAASLSPTSVSAMEVRVSPHPPVLAGTAQTFRVATGATKGEPRLEWDFGDGSPVLSSAKLQVSHTYERPGHYAVLVFVSDATSRGGSSFVQTVHEPILPVSPSHSSTIVLDQARRRVWNVNPDNDSVSATDTTTMSRSFERSVGRRPRNLAQAPDGTIWVTNQDSSDITVLHPDSGAKIGRIELPYASQPFGIAFAPGARGAAYVSLFATGRVLKIDSATRRIVASAEVFPTPAAIAISPDARVLVTRFISPADHGVVAELEPNTLATLRSFVLDVDPGPDTDASGRGILNFLSSIVISPGGTRAFLSAKKDDTVRGPMRDGVPMRFDSFVRSVIAVIDLVANVELPRQRKDVNNRSLPCAIELSALGDYAFFATEGNNWVGMIDTFTMDTASAIRDVGKAPNGLVLAPDGKLFVNGFLSRTLRVYDVAAAVGAVDSLIPPALTTIRTVEREALTPEVLRGKQIFFDASDPRMDRDGYISCSTCHFEGLHDGRVWDFTDRGEGLRSTQSLLGRRGAAEGRLHWTGNFDEVQDFERDMRDSFQGTGFLPDALYDVGTRRDPLGDPKAGLSPELDALAAYLRTLDRVDPSPFRNRDGSFTDDAKRGRLVFQAAGCPTCHSGPDLTDSALGVLHDVGTILRTSGKRLGQQLTGLDVPTLKGVWEKAPYLHDGRATTLKEIFTRFNPHDLLGRTSKLSTRELDQLVAYLQQLDDVPEPKAGCACAVAPAPRSDGIVAALSTLAGWLICRCRRWRGRRSPR